MARVRDAIVLTAIKMLFLEVVHFVREKAYTTSQYSLRG